MYLHILYIIWKVCNIWKFVVYKFFKAAINWPESRIEI